MRHSASHVLAHAVLKLYPDARLGIGPAIDDGFYYDFEFQTPITEDDLPGIEKEMKKIVKKDLPLHQEMMSRDKAIEKLKDSDQPYKVELLEEIPDKEISFYVTGENEFSDLCRGPHVESTGKVGAFKLDRIAGAYWRGDEKRPMLTRIYAFGFETQKELDEYIEMRERLKEIDHRKLGKEMDLFSFHEESPGNVFWHPKGQKLMLKLMEYWREVHEREGYVEVRTPVLLTKETWKQSGHLDFFIEKMYLAKTHGADDYDYAVKPMNCDGGILIYKNEQRSYRDLPMRVGELGVVHRHESSGELHGILRPREFTQDDAHIYCTPDQVKEEFKKVMKLCFDFYDTFGLELDHVELSTRPEKSIGSDEIWDRAESTLKEVLAEEDVEWQINEGDGAFYGPKVDFHLNDSMGRTWQCATVQLDFAQPENFDLEYIDENGEKQRPVMIHRVVYGSLERFLGVLIEHYGGVFPLWIAPEQVIIIPISNRHAKYAEEVMDQLKQHKIRVKVDDRNETMQSRIREAETQKIPYVLVVGDKEQENASVAVRKHGKGDQGMVSLDEFINLIIEEIRTKTYEQE